MCTSVNNLGYERGTVGGVLGGHLGFYGLFFTAGMEHILGGFECVY